MPRITMPQLGETVTEGTVTRWLKQVGDHVDVDEPLLDVSTEKVDTEVPAAFAGTISRITVAEGETVPIGTVLCVIGEDPDAGELDHLHHDPTIDHTADAREGARGALVGHQAWLGHRPHLPPLPAHPRAAAAAPPAQPAPVAPPLPDLAVRERLPFSTVRRATARHLRSSLSTAARTLTTVEVDYTAVERTRAGTDLSYLPFIALATCRALGEWPRMNASVGEDELVVWRDVNLGVAVDLNHEGLVVPVVRGAGDLRLRALAEAIRERSGAARALALGADAFAGGTFTITNAGAYGTVVTGPVINTPQIAILSVDGVRPRPVAVPAGDAWAVAVRTVGNLSLSFDHRAVDGAYATAFLARVRELLETLDWSAELGS